MIALLLPGMDGTGRTLEPFAARLESYAEPRIVRYPADLICTYAQLVAQVREQVPRRQPYIIIAESYSGPIALDLAAHPLGSLRAVVLVASFASLPYGRLGAWFSRAISYYPIPRWAMHRVLMNGSPRTDVLQTMAAAVASVRRDVLTARIREALRAETGAKPAVRVIHLAAAHDRVLRNQTIPFSETSTIPGPHLLLECEPETCIAEMLRLRLLENPSGD